MILLAIFLVLLFPFSAIAQVPTYISSMSDYQVRALSGSFAPTNGTSTITAVNPQPDPFPPGARDLSGIIAEWSGGFKATGGTRMFVTGGGHNGGGNNGVFTFDYSGTSAPLGWTVLGQSSIGSYVACANSYSDGKPSATHNYDGLIYNSGNGFGYRFGGFVSCSFGTGDASTWKINLSNGAWTKLTDNPGSMAAERLTMHDPVSGKILVAGGGTFSYAVFNTNTDTWSAGKTSPTAFGDASGGNDMCGAYDTSRGRGVILGDGAVSRLVTMNWSTETATVTTASTSGSTGILGSGGISCFYDPARDSFWLFGGPTASSGWTNIYEMNASTFVITAHALTGTAISIGSFDMAGSYGRFVFMPAYRAIGTIASVTSPAYVIKLPAASGGDTTAPTVPTSLSATAAGSTQIDLSWTASTDAVGVTGYNIYRCTVAACTPVSLFASTGATTTYSNTGLTASTLYRYAVSATDAAGNESARSTTTEATTSAVSPPGGLPSFTLTSPGSGTKPFTFGHAFKQGDVPSGQTVTSTDAVSMQVDIKNAWADGSAKFAVLSGRAALTAATAKTIQLSLTAPPGGTALTEANLTSNGVTASIQYGATCTVNLSSLIGATSTLSGGRMTAGRVRTWASGPLMSNWIYYSRCGSDAHLSVWFDVRLYSSGEVEIVPWIENATLNIAGPTNKTGTATFVMNGTTRYTGSLPMPHHTRAVLASGTTLSHWSGTDPAVTPKHNVTYLQTTKMVPSYYGTTSAGSALWGRVASSYTPFTAAQIPYVQMSGTGYGVWIGLLGEWEAAYITSGGDPRAYTGAIINQYAAGFHGIYYRDETTNQVLRYSTYPNLVINGTASNFTGGTGASSTNSYTPTPGGSVAGEWDIAHHPELGYFTYLLTGRFYFLEQLQFATIANYLANTDVNRQFSGGVILSQAGANLPRGAAWALRDLGMSIAVTPDGETLRTEFLNSFASNINYYHGTYVAQANNTQGHVEPFDHYGPTAEDALNPPGVWSHSSFMDDFFTACVGYTIDLVTGLSGANQTKLSAFFTWKAAGAIGRLGGTGATEFYFADAANHFTLPWAPSNSADFAGGTGPWYATWGAVYDAEFGSPHPNLPVDGNLRGGNFPDGTSYWGNLQPAIAYAVQHGVAGALTAYNRMIGAGNWSSLLATWNNDPIWGVKPLSLSVVVPPAALVAPTNVAVTTP